MHGCYVNTVTGVTNLVLGYPNICACSSCIRAFTLHADYRESYWCHIDRGLTQATQVKPRILAVWLVTVTLCAYGLR